MALPFLEQVAASSKHVAPGMLIVAVGSVLVLGLASLAVLAMRRASGSARYQVWLLGFVGVLVLPLVSAVLPRWQVLSRLHARGEAQSALFTVQEPVEVPAPSIPPSSFSDSSTKIANVKNPLNISPTRSQPGKPEMNSAAVPQNTAAISPAPVAPPLRVQWTIWVILCWVLGSVLVLCRMILGHLSLWWLERRCTKVSGGEIFNLLQRLHKELGLRRPVVLLSSEARTMPMTWGIWRARLLVPEQAAAWPAGQRRDVLLHELGHVRRRDCLTQCIAQVACALYWFNPLAWVASGRMQVERERACDDLVLSRGAEAASYAKHLLQSVSSVPWSRLVGPAVAMATPSTLEERMRAILDPRVSRRSLTARGTIAIVLLLTLSLLPMAAIKAQQAPPDNRGDSQPGRIRGSGSAASPTTRPGGRLGRGGFGGALGMPAPTLGEGPTSTFDATIYDVRVPVDQIGRLDIDALARAAENVDAFEKALAGYGPVKPMYRAHQSVRLTGDTIMISSQVPIVTSNSVTATGHTVSNYSYQNLGAHFSLAGRAGGPASELDLNIQLSSASDAGTTVAENVKVPVIRTATLLHKGPFQPQKPFVVVSVDADSPDKDGKAVAYIARIIMGEADSGGKP